MDRRKSFRRILGQGKNLASPPFKVLFSRYVSHGIERRFVHFHYIKDCVREIQRKITPKVPQTKREKGHIFKNK